MCCLRKTREVVSAGGPKETWDETIKIAPDGGKPSRSRSDEGVVNRDGEKTFRLKRLSHETRGSMKRTMGRAYKRPGT